MATETTAPTTRLKPIVIYDHLPGILAGYPALVFLGLAGLSLPHAFPNHWWSWKVLSEDTIFWIGLVVAISWYIAFRFNLPKRRFWLVFGLIGTFIGIPVVLEITGYISPFTWLGRQLGKLAPSVSVGAWFIVAVAFGIDWLGNLVWSRTHMRVKIDESGLMIRRMGGKGERFDLIGLKTEDEPLDYLERFLAGIGSLSLKSRLNKPIFTMKRVVGLYRSPLFPWKKGKLARIEEMLSYQGKVLAVDPDERAELAEAADATDEDDALSEDGMDDTAQSELDNEDGEVETTETPDIK